MEQPTTNNPLLVRALERGRGPEPYGDFTRRIMEHIARQEVKRARRENRLLLTGAIAGGLGLAALGAAALYSYAHTTLFSSLGRAFSHTAGAVAETFRSTASDIPAASSADNGFLLSVWCYMGVLFLVLGLTGQLLSRKRL